MAPDLSKITRKIFEISTAEHFNELSLEVFRFQYSNNAVYRRYCDLLGADPSAICLYKDIPCLPVELFRNNTVASVEGMPELVFRSSGTTSANRSAHLVFDPALYRKSILSGFRHFYGDPEDYCFIALIPDAKDHPDSSLAYMAQVLITESRCPAGGFYLNAGISDAVKKAGRRRLFIFGLGYALLDAMNNTSLSIPDSIIMETGGMKGRRKELTREELHSLLSSGFNVNSIHSEYSMCELFSQAYATTDGSFSCPPWMDIMVRDLHDPLNDVPFGKTGIINIIDLANIHTCSFIATRDMGRKYESGLFEILGRADHSDLRGCSLMMEQKNFNAPSHL